MKRMTYSEIGLALVFGLAVAAQGPTTAKAQSSSDDSLGTYARQIKKDSGTSSKRVFDNDNLPKDDKLSIVGSARPAADSNAASDDSNTAAPGEAKPATENKTDEQSAGKGEDKAETQAASKTPDAAGKPDAKTDDTSAANSKSDTTTGETKAVAQAPPTQAPGQVRPAGMDNSPATPQTPEEEQAAKEKMWKQWGEKLDSQRESVGLLNRELDVLQREYQLRQAAMYGDAGNRFRNQADWDKQDAQYKQQIADKQKAIEDAKQKLDDMQEDARKSGVPASVREQ
jgi:hypothetical protein